jgi:hypothetical protein
MPGSKHAVTDHARQHITAAQVGRQLRAAFEPVPVGSGDFADLLAKLDRVERAERQLAAE